MKNTTLMCKYWGKNLKPYFDTQSKHHISNNYWRLGKKKTGCFCLCMKPQLLKKKSFQGKWKTLILIFLDTHAQKLNQLTLILQTGGLQKTFTGVQAVLLRTPCFTSVKEFGVRAHCKTGKAKRGGVSRNEHVIHGWDKRSRPRCCVCSVRYINVVLTHKDDHGQKLYEFEKYINIFHTDFGFLGQSWMSVC